MGLIVTEGKVILFNSEANGKTTEYKLGGTKFFNDTPIGGNGFYAEITPNYVMINYIELENIRNTLNTVPRLTIYAYDRGTHFTLDLRK